MALAVIMTIQDNKGKTSTLEINLVPTIATVAEVVNAAQSLALLIDPLINGRIVRVTVGVAVSIVGFVPLSDPASVTSDVEEGARFQFLTDTGFYTGFRIPTFREDLILPGTDQVNIADLGVAALIDAVTNQLSMVPGGGTGNVTIVDKRDVSISSLSSARESFQASRRRD